MAIVFIITFLTEKLAYCDRQLTNGDTQRFRAEMLREMRYDLSEFAGSVLTLEILDESDDGWGHINLDDIKIFEARP